jgi:hypothetical protein
MAVLILNIGKSDLLIKSTSFENYWIPIGFDREEANISFTGISNDEKYIWESREDLTVYDLYPQLKIDKPEKNERRKFSNKQTYRTLTEKIWDAYNLCDTWHSLIQPSGRITGAIETISSKFKLEKIYIFVTDQPNPHEGDSCFSFKIFQRWFGREDRFKDLKFVPISLDFDPRGQDRTLQFYYESIERLIIAGDIKEKDILAVSIKGGTPQMQSALQMQSIASGISRQLFIEPQLNIAKILRGESSNCQIVSYWRYLRLQKYQTLKLLLDSRWDFDGAKAIVEEWRDTLKFIKQYIETDDRSQIEQELSKLDKIVKTLDKGVNNLNLAAPLAENEPADRFLNIYTQCRMYWHLNQVANFLTRLGMFYEEILRSIVKSIDPSNSDFNGDRYEKRTFAGNLVTTRKRDYLDDWKKIEAALSSLEYWVSRRNDLIHDSRGLSKDSMNEKFQRLEVKPSAPDDILKQMAIVADSTLKIIGQYNKHTYLDSDRYTAPYYLYSATKEQVIKQLNIDS